RGTRADRPRVPPRLPRPERVPRPRHRPPSATASPRGGRRRARSCRRRSIAAFVGEIANPVPGRALEFRSKSTALETRASEAESAAAATPLLDLLAKPGFDQSPDRRPLPRGDFARLVENAVGDFYCRLHMGKNIL